ncbi:MAG: hypothetical protein RLZZ50_77, partial [Verrucomicrobiota bacterium]
KAARSFGRRASSARARRWFAPEADAWQPLRETSSVSHKSVMGCYVFIFRLAPYRPTTGC